jgi:hypothetical protein
MSLENLSSDNARTLWEWKGQKEFDEVKQAIIADRKQVQKWANRAASGKLSISDLKRLQLSLLCLIDNEEHFARVKQVKRKAESVS